QAHGFQPVGFLVRARASFLHRRVPSCFTAVKYFVPLKLFWMSAGVGPSFRQDAGRGPKIFPRYEIGCSGQTGWEGGTYRDAVIRVRGWFVGGAGTGAWNSGTVEQWNGGTGGADSRLARLPVRQYNGSTLRSRPPISPPRRVFPICHAVTSPGCLA